MFPQQQPGSQTPQQVHTVLGSVYVYTYTDPSTGKSIQYPDIWTRRPSPFFYAGYHGSIVDFYDSNGSRVASEGSTIATRCMATTDYNRRTRAV